MRPAHSVVTMTPMVSLLRVTAFVIGLLLAGISAFILAAVAISEDHPSAAGWVVLCVMVILGAGVVGGAARLLHGREGGNSGATNDHQSSPDVR